MSVPADELDVTPWYRQFWPWFLIILPTSAVIAGLTTLAIAIKTRDSLVVGDYAKIGMATEQMFERDQAAAKLGVAADLSFDRTGGRVTLVLHGPAAAREPALKLRLIHPTQEALDRRVELAVGPDGRYYGGFKAPLEGRWGLRLEPQDSHWRLTGEIAPGTQTVALKPWRPSPG